MSTSRGQSSRRTHDNKMEALPEFLRRLGVRPRIALGQHFLVDEFLLARIADACMLNPDDTVVEVGAGPGVLSLELAERARSLVAIEIDEELAALARRQLEGHGTSCVIAADVLDISVEEMFAECGASAPYVMVGNLPYYITQPVIRRFLESKEPPKRIVVLIQREVARRIVGGPGKESLLSLSVKTYGRPEVLFDVSSSAFWPEPKVQSAVVLIERLARPAVELPPDELSRFFLLLRAGFAEPRKQLHNGLRSALGLTREEVHSLLEEALIDPALRAQHLALRDWQRLHALVQVRHPESLDVG